MILYHLSVSLIKEQNELIRAFTYGSLYFYTDSNEYNKEACFNLKLRPKQAFVYFNGHIINEIASIRNSSLNIK
ncbi:hypothetical protein DN757_24715 [Paenibacillus silvae]|uniref:Uncharacterized protein n=1 Tax=Paenibacillus silvae TaxID=1325358 RepID=A0A2W6NAL8_9BACL|nr:hypothetical protein DN757_24715 [Paenibacillus silvae]